MDCIPNFFFIDKNNNNNKQSKNNVSMCESFNKQEKLSDSSLTLILLLSPFLK